ncbi:hypothetical protein AMK32_27550 [Streptomyces sp. CB01883]|nr:hypothetical protein AMK32_27550 [Streptomyces sp. CB01883]
MAGEAGTRWAGHGFVPGPAQRCAVRRRSQRQARRRRQAPERAGPVAGTQAVSRPPAPGGRPVRHPAGSASGRR